MSDQHTTTTPPAPPAPSIWAGEAKKVIATLLTAAIIGYVSSWLNSQRSQSDLENRISRVEDRSEINSKNIAQNSAVLQQNVIRLAEMGVIQNNILEQIRDLKTEQAEIKAMLNRK